MTLRRKVGSSRSVLASSSVPARTLLAAGAMKSSGSSDCATSPSWHANRCRAGRRKASVCTVGQWSPHPIPARRPTPCGGPCAGCPTSPDCSRCALPASSATASSRPVWPAGCCSTRSAPPHPWAVAGAFAVLFLPYSLLGPFAGALLDRWDRRVVLICGQRGAGGPGPGRRRAAGRRARVIWSCCAGRWSVNGFSRFVTSGLSAALPHVVPREQVVTMNSVATAVGAIATFLGANFMLVPRWLVGDGRRRGGHRHRLGGRTPVAVALLLSLRFRPRVLGPDHTAVHGLAVLRGGHRLGLRTARRCALRLHRWRPPWPVWPSHRMVFGINTLLVLVHRPAHRGRAGIAGLGTAVVFVAATGVGSFLATRAGAGGDAAVGPLRGRQHRTAVRRGHPDSPAPRWSCR